jgi:hypothetical protein
VHVSGEQLGEVEGGVAEVVSDQDGDGVPEGLAEQPTAQVPGIGCPDPLGVVALDELTRGGLDPVPDSTEEPASV